VLQPEHLYGGRIATPLGDLVALVNRQGQLTRLAFPLEVNSHRWRIPAHKIHWEQSAVSTVAEQITAYFAGRRRRFDLDLAPGGTVFQRTVWAALQNIPFGTIMSYGQLAAELGHAAAPRATGAANGANPISLVIPCHRLVGASGALTGYAGGLGVKRALLQFEGALPAAS
jgi:methylated-DNA-[protein]-cysteine S-methyltransferase